MSTLNRPFPKIKPKNHNNFDIIKIDFSFFGISIIMKYSIKYIMSLNKFIIEVIHTFNAGLIENESPAFLDKINEILKIFC